MKWLAILVAAALQAGPGLSISPTSGPPGTSVEIRGSGFASREPLAVSWDGNKLPGRVQVSEDGTFDYRVTVPDEASPGTHTIRVRGPRSGTVSAVFTVRAAPSPAPTSPRPSSGPDATTAPDPTTTLALDGPADVVAEVILDIESISTVASPVTTPAAIGAGEDESTGLGPGPASNERSAGGAFVTALATIGMILLGLAAVRRWDTWRAARRERGENHISGEESAEPPVPVPPVDAEGDRWKRRGVSLPPDFTYESVIRRSGRLYAFGARSASRGDPVAVVWGSDDGLDWAEAVQLDAGRTSFGKDWHGDLIAFGTLEEGEYFSTACWASSDGGRWDRRTKPGDETLKGVTFDGAAADDAVMIAWGRGPAGPGVWISTDTVTWEPTGLRGRIDLVSPIPGGFAAFGHGVDEKHPIVASSPDARSWSMATDTETMFGFEGVAITSLVTFAGGLVAAGTDRVTNTATLWVSDDAAGWYPVSLDAPPNTSIEHLVPAGDHLVAVGRQAPSQRSEIAPRLIAWETSDAVSWTPTVQPDLLEYSVPVSVITEDDTVIVYGYLTPGGQSPWPEATHTAWILEPARIHAMAPAPPDSPVRRDGRMRP